MTTTITLMAVCIIAAALATFAAIQRARINALLSDIDRERARHKVTNELLTKARNEAKVESDLRRQAERNLAEANEATRDWKSDAMTYQARLRKYQRPRDPKTGRFYSAKKVISDAFNSPEVVKLCDDVKANASAGI